MTLKTIVFDTCSRLAAMPGRARAFAGERPLVAAGLLMAAGVALGAGARSGVGMAETAPPGWASCRRRPPGSTPSAIA